LIVCSGKSEAEVTIITDSAGGIILLKLTTDGHKASCGLSTTAGLLVYLSSTAWYIVFIKDVIYSLKLFMFE